MSEQTTFPRRPATIFNDFKYPLPASAKPIEGSRFPATWNWEIAVKGNKIYMKINDGVYGRDDPNAKLKEVELNYIERNSILFALQEAVDDADFKSTQIDIKRKLFNPTTNRPNDTPTLQATITIIRGKNGVIKVHYKRSTYEVTFVMTSSFLECRTRNEQGEWEDNPGLVSRVYTKSFIEFSRKFLDKEEWTRYEREQKTTNNQSTTSNAAKPPSSNQDFDEDFDF